MNLQEDLNRLGKNCDAIAKQLLSSGCRGKRDSMGQCPIAIYLAKKGYHHPLVLSTCIVVGEGDDRISMEPSELITAFINRFDRRGYRQLETNTKKS